MQNVDSERELVKECLAGKRESQKLLYEHYAPVMLGVCYRYAASRMEAEDFLQEAFILVFRKLQQYKGSGELGAWIRRIVVNTSLNGIKARHRFTEGLQVIPIDSVNDDRNFGEKPEGNDLIELVHRLPPGYKTVFNLFANEGYSHDEIGEMLGIKASTSRSQYSRARELLLRKLNNDLKNITNDR